MSRFSFVKGRKSGTPTPADLSLSFSDEGITYSASPAGVALAGDVSGFKQKSELARFLSQIEEEGFVSLNGNAAFLEWENVFRLMESPDHSDSLGLLGLPPVESWRPALESRGSLTDPSFSIALAGWTSPSGSKPRGNITIVGALLRAGGKDALLPRVAWETARSVFALNRSKAANGHGDAEANRRAWAAIRAKAVAAGADLSDFLAKTIVITPEKLNIDLRNIQLAGSRVVEVVPGFSGQPRRWIEIFDRLETVHDRYEIPDGDGLTHVLISPEVRTVLREIKLMPGRRVAGDRAEAFLRNPFATLGPDAGAVVDPEQFEHAREAAAISFARFVARVRRDEAGYPFDVALLIEESANGQFRAERITFEGTSELETFLKKLDARIAAGAQCCHWNGFDLEVLGDTPAQAEMLKSALADRRAPKDYTLSELLDLSHYSERIERFGVEEPYYSPFIARKSTDAGWFPENVDFGVFYTPEDGGDTIAVALTGDGLEAFRKALAGAKDDERAYFAFPGCPKGIPVAWAEEALAAFTSASKQVQDGTFDPAAPKGSLGVRERRGLVVKPNVDTLDYLEARGSLVSPVGEAPTLPASLRRHVTLKLHQKQGIAWLQHLWSKSPTDCRGALLADDMGLGKTIQLLAFIASVLEERPRVDPFLVVAPVSLLDNWKEEIDKFFEPGTFNVLTLYGPALSQKRLPKEALDAELAGKGITTLLRRDWLGGANLVLTTYETLRDLEFSLALQRWSAVICDEAQKVKNPNAMVTRAVKKQNAQFKIACTGTPVENTLTDIWCLFDFVQPGLLGALKEFGERYRKPIEAETDEEKERVAELRVLIEPQKLRRTKADVAKDLPKKIEDPECRALQISQRQRALYAEAIVAFRRRSGDAAGTGISHHLGLLHRLRRLCSDPTYPGSVASNLALADIVAHSPKMAWLLKQLEVVRQKAEKAIVFCEFRDLQRTLQRAIAERFGFEPNVINGDTTTTLGSKSNRQHRLKAFQEKPGFGVIILSPLAVGFGVNIQAANHVVHFTRTWNPAREDQATDRAYRIGQERDVYVYYPVVVASDFLTFDEKLDKLLDKKRELSDDMLNGTVDVGPAEFSDLGAPDGMGAFGDEYITPEDLRSLDPNMLETFCAVLWSKLGYSKTRRTSKSGDGGIDVVAISGKEGVLIQCKSTSVERELGWEAVKDVVGGAAAYASMYPGITFSLVAVSNARFNRAARAQAAINHVELVDCADLARRLCEKPIRRRELIS